VRSPEIPENFKRTQNPFLRVEKPLGGFSTPFIISETYTMRKEKAAIRGFGRMRGVV
jgi:hypothetical protein